MERIVLVSVIRLGLGGCLLLTSQPGRPEPAQALEGPPVFHRASAVHSKVAGLPPNGDNPAMRP